MSTVDHVIEVTFMEGRDRDSLKPVKGWLGVGHDDRGPLFGEVMHGDKDYRSFTMRCYRMDEYLKLDRMSQEGLLLDAGSSRNMVLIPAEQVQTALDQLPRPVSQLLPGDTVQLRRNPDHPAWKDRVEGEYGMEFTTKPDFEPVIADGVKILERRAPFGESGRLGPAFSRSEFRASNGFWYDADGSQAHSGATEIVSEISLSGAKIAQAEPAAPAIAEPAPELDVTETTELDRFDRAAATLGEQIDAYSSVISQWNRHNEKMQPRIESGWRSIQVAEDDLDHFGSLAKRDPELPAFDAGEVTRRREDFAERLEQSSVELTTGMDRIGAHLPQKRVAPSAEHVARLAELKSAPSRFEQPALAENEASLT